MTTKYADALTDVVKRTVNFMFPVEARLIERRREHAREAPFEVSGIVGVTGATRGSLVISFPMSLAKQLTAWMLHEDDPEGCSGQDVSDCVGELANIVAGNLLPLLSEDEGRTAGHRISLPSVVVGPHRVVWSRKDTPCELMLFETGAGTFAAEISFRDNVAES